MSQQPFQMLQVKYNSTRRPEYRVTTQICEDAQGRFVLKRANGDAAAEHLHTIHENGLAIQDYYAGGVRVISSEATAYGLRFPFIKGQTLASQVSMARFDRDAFVARVNERLDIVLNVQDKYRVPFHMTPAFEAEFGPAGLEGVPALNPANIDALFSNFIDNDQGIFCIDCEWLCRFPVPVNFIKYRILLYLYVTQAHAELEGTPLKEMLGWFGLTEEECALYWRMDDHFQQHVHGEGRRYVYPERYRKMDLSLEFFRQSLDARQAKIAKQDAKITEYKNKILKLKEDVRARDEVIHRLSQDYQTIADSTFWRMTGPARKLLDAFKGGLRRSDALYVNLRMVKDICTHGMGFAKSRRRTYLENQAGIKAMGRMPTEEELARERAETFPRDITFSILVPLYNTPEGFLRQMIESVQAQTYPKWELCLADGSDAEHADVERICRACAEKDGRIRYQKLSKNLGISGNTNACIDMSTGAYIALFDHDDMLHPSALYENMKAICEQDADFIYSDEATFHKDPSDTYWAHYKPDFGPDTLRSYNYICHLTVFNRALMEAAGGGFRSKYDGSQDFDMVLRLTERAKRIVHIPKVLYFWRSHEASVASGIGAKPYTIAAGKSALADHLERVGLKGDVLDSSFPSTYRVQYAIEGQPLVSIVIPNMDHVADLRQCVDSIAQLSTWRAWEIIIVENNSREPETFEYYRTLESRPEIRVVRYKGGFNFSAICNFGAKAARGDHILLLNNDIKVISPDWLEQMLMFSQRPDVGAVGAMLYYPDDTIQHAGLIIGIGGSAGHSHKGFRRGDIGYLQRLTLAQDLSGVTGACCMVPRQVWEDVGGLDESFAVAFNDVDLCLRIRKAGYLIVWTPYAELYHFESKSRGYEDTPEKQARFQGERTHLRERWGDVIDAGDPYYNPNLTLDREDFSFR